MKVRPFAALRPSKGLVTELAAPPYDVLNSLEAKNMAGEKSILHITKAEIDFDPILDENSPQVYSKAVENLEKWCSNGWLVQDPKPCYYVYSQTMEGRSQYGFMLCASCEEYLSGSIKKHELTRRDKEDDRTAHICNLQANMEPAFFSFKPNEALESILREVSSGEPEYSFEDEHSFVHRFWTVQDQDLIDRITFLFDTQVDAFYIADGHHRTAASARVKQVMDQKNPSPNGEEEYNYFLTVCFPENQLRILDYNRIVKDLNGLDQEQFLELLKADFEIEKKGKEEYRPCHLHNISMYLQGEWYSLEPKEGRYNDEHPIDGLDVTILSRYVLDKILGIKDLRTDQRIDFVGGIRGLGELKDRVDNFQAKLAFALYPVSMKQLTQIADAGMVMPPKTTWFEPKLRSGLAIHLLK